MGKFFEGTGHYYEYISRKTNWWPAVVNSTENIRHGVPGYLVEINDHAENEFVSNLAGNNRVWIGLSDYQKEGHYVWTNGNTPNYTNWQKGEPNNATHLVNLFVEDEDYIGMYSNGTWNDFNDYVDNMGYVIEYDVPKIQLEDVSISNGIEGSTGSIITFNFNRSLEGYESLINLNVELTVDGQAIPNNYQLQNAGNGTVGINGNVWTFNGSTDEFQVRITRDDLNLDKQIQEIKFNVQAKDGTFVTTANHQGTAYLLEDESEISLGNGLIQKIYLPNTGDNGSNTFLLEDKVPDYTLLDTEIDYQSRDDFYSKLGLKDNFSIRWETYISIPESGDYIFGTTTDDGVRLIINNENGSPIGYYESWKNQGSTYYPTELYNLKKGDVVWLQFDYYQNLGGAQAHLQWQKPGDSNLDTIPADAMFLTEELAKTGNTIDELTSGENTKPGFVFVANSKLDDDNTYAIPTQDFYNLDFSLSEGDKYTTFRTDEANRQGDNVGFPTDDYAIYTKNSEEVFNTFRTPESIGSNDYYKWQTNDDTAGTIGVEVLSDSFGEKSESINAVLKPGEGYGVNSDNKNLERNLIIGDASPKLSITKGEDAIEGDWGWFVVNTGGVSIPEGGMYVYYSIDNNKSTATRITDSTSSGDFYSPSTYMMWDDNFKAEDYFFLPPESTSANLYISAIGDAIDEGSESVTIEIKPIPEALEAVKKKDNGEIDYSYLFEQYTVDETAASATLKIHDIPISDADTPRFKTDEDGKTIYKLPSYPYQAGVSITPVNRTGYVEEIRSDSNNNVSLNVVLNSKPTSDVAVLLSTETGTWSDSSQEDQDLFFTPENWDTPQLLIINSIAENQVTTVSWITYSGDENYLNTTELKQSVVPFNYVSSLVDPKITLWETGIELKLVDKLIIDNNSGKEDSYTTSLKLVSKNRDSVLIPAGTKLQYIIDETENNPEQSFTLTLTNDLSIKSDQQVDDIPVVASNATDELDLNSIDPSSNDKSNTSLYIASVNNNVPDIPIVSVKAIHDSEGSINRYGFQFILGSKPETEDDIDIFFNLTASEGFFLDGDSKDVVNTLKKSATNDSYVITIPKGDTSAAFLLKPIDDLYAEGEEKLTLDLIKNEKYQFTPESGTTTAILSDDEFIGVGIFAFTSIGKDRASSWTNATNFVVNENDSQEGNFTPIGIRLESKPTSSVTLRLVEESYTSEEIKVTYPIGFEGEPIELFFTPDNWNKTQEIQIEGVDDSIIDGNQTRVLTFNISSDDEGYKKLKRVNTSIINIDNDGISANESLNTLSKSSEKSNLPIAQFLSPSSSFIDESGSTVSNFEIKLSDKAIEETLVFFNRDQYVSSAEWTDFTLSSGEGSKFLNGLAQYIDNQQESIEQTDFDGIDETFEGFNEGEFTSTWSGYLYIPESGHYNFIVDIIGGFALTINGEEYLNKPNNTKGKYHVNDLILEHGDFIDITFDYIGYENKNHKAQLLWERPNSLEETYVKEIIPSKYFHRTKGFALVIPEGEDSATLTLNAIDDNIDESSESLSIELQESTGLKLLVKSQDKVFKNNDSNNDYFLNLSLTQTDRESVLLKAGTELQFGVDQIIDENTTQEASLAYFTLLEDTTFHRSKSTKATGSLIWTEDGLNSTYNQSLIGLVSGHETTLYQLLDPGVDLNLVDKLTLVESTENSDGTTDFSYLASIQLGTTNRESVSIPAGTKLDYIIAATDETDVQSFTLYLKNDLTINSEETIDGIAVTSNSRNISIGLDLTQIEPIPNEEINADGLSVKSFIAEYRIERNAKVDIIDDDHAGFEFSLDNDANNLVDSAAFTINEGDDAITRYVQLTSKPTAPVQLYLETDQSKKSVLKSYDQITNEWNEGTSRIKLKFMPWDWDQPQKFQVQSIDDQIISEDVLATIHTEVKSVDPFYEEQAIFLSITDQLVLDISSENRYLATLKLDPTERADDTIRIPSGTTLNYSFEEASSTQSFSLTLVEDLNIKSDQQVENIPVFVSNTTDGLDFTSIDPSTISEGDSSSYKAIYEIPSSTISFNIVETDVPVIEARILQNEISEASNGFVTLRLNNQPSSPVTINLTPSDKQFTIGDRGVGMQDSLVFTPKNWDVIQSVEIRSVNDELVEDITTSQLNILSNSDDPNFNKVSNTIHIDIVSEDLPTATIAPIVDSSEEAEPGRFRINLSDPAPSSAGSNGVVIQYQIDSLNLDQRGGLPYTPDVENINKITQSPGVTTGEVRIAPGQSFSDVLVVPIDDRYADAIDKSFSVSLLKSEDNTYEIKDDENNSTTVNIINNDIAGIYTQVSGEFLRVSENPVGPGVCAVGLLTKPAGNVTIKITEESIDDIYQLSNDEDKYTPFEATLVFDSSTWYVPQMFEAYGWNEGIIEDGTGDYAGTGIHNAKLKYEFISTDTDYNTFDLNLIDKLAFIGSTEKTDGTTEFSYEASFKLSTTDQRQVIIPAGTELNYTIAATEETELETFTLHLENELTINTEEEVTGIAVTSNSSQTSIGKELVDLQSDITQARFRPDHYTNNTQQSVEVVDKYLEGEIADSINNSLIHIQDGIDTLNLPLLGNLDGKTGSGISEFIHTLTDGIRSIGQFTPRKLESFINDQLTSILGPKEEGQYATITEPSLEDLASEFIKKRSLFLSITDKLVLDSSSESSSSDSSSSENRYLATLKLDPTEIADGPIRIPLGTTLNYSFLEAESTQSFSLTLVEDLNIQSDQQVENVPVFVSNTTDGLDLNSIDPSTISEEDTSSYKALYEIPSDLIATLDFNFGKKEENIGSVPLDSELGIPGFGLQSSGSVDAFYGYDANLGLVFSSNEEHGYIYLNTEEEKTNLKASLSAALSDDASFTGALGFLQIDAKNQESVNENVQILNPITKEERQAKTEMDVSIDLNLHNGLGKDGVLTFNEITQLTNPTAIKELFNYDINGNSAMSFGVETTIDGSAAIPSFGFDLASEFPLFDYSNSTEAADSDNATSIYFDNIQLDLGSYISNMLSPVVDGIDDILTPIYPVVDALYSDTQIFSKLGLVSTFDMDGDNQVSPIDLSNWFADFYAGMDKQRGDELKHAVATTTDFLGKVKGVMDLVRDLEEISVSGDNFYIDYGNYELEAFKAGYSEAEAPKVDENTPGTDELAQDTASKSVSTSAGGSSNPFAGVMSQLNDLGFDIPLIDDPTKAINLLLGQDVELFTWEMPGMGMSAEIEKTFPVYPGIEGVIQGGFGVDAHIGFGFDTYGLSEWKDSDFELDDAWKVFNGFYVADWDKHGNDIPEFTLDAGMGAGLGVNAVVVRADMTGGINAEASLDLLDEGEVAGTSDGKIRGEEITSRIDNPLSLFELVGDLSAYLEAKVQVGIDLLFYSYWETVWEEKLATIPLFEFGVGGSYGSGTASNGYLDGSTVFFDHNFNGRIESLEPRSITGNDASYDFRVDHQTFDINQNGAIDLSEGWIMAFGGTDSSTGLPLELPFLAPLGEMLTPLTTVHTLAIHSGFNDENVKEWIDEAFYLRGFNYLEHDPVLELRDAETINNPEIQDSLSAYLAHVKIHLGLDILSSTLKNALPDTSNDKTTYDLELMSAYTTALFEQSSSTPLKTLLYNAIKDTSEYLHIEEKENFKYIFAKVTEAAADANYELSERLDLIVSQGIEENRSPSELIATIDNLKEYVATEYREKVANLSHDIHLIADLDTDGENDLLRTTIDQRLEDLHGDFVPRIEQALDKLTGKLSTDYEIGKEYKLSYIRDYDGNLQGGLHDEEMECSYEYQGYLDVNGDGEKELIYTNKESRRWVTAEVDPLTGQIDYDDNGKDGSTRVVGIYADPLIAEGEANNGFLSDGVTPAPSKIDAIGSERYIDLNNDKDFNDTNEDRLALNSQVRFQNDLAIDNLTVKTSGDYDGDGIHEIYWKINDGSAYLRSLMHDDGNIRYANYQSEDQMKEYLTTQGHSDIISEII